MKGLRLEAWGAPALVLSSALCFALMDSMVKLLAGDLGALEVVFARYALNLAMAWALLMPGARSGSFRTGKPGLAWARGASLAASSWCMALALASMPVGQATAVGFCAPLAAALAAPWFLGEKRRHWQAACSAGALSAAAYLAGAGSGFALSPGYGWAAAAALFNALYQLLSVKLAGERPGALMWRLAAAGCGIYGLAFACGGAWTRPSGIQWCLLAAVGAAGLAGHWMLTAACKKAGAQEIAPLQYAQLPWALALGFALFGDWPGPGQLAAMAAIALFGWASRLSVSPKALCALWPRSKGQDSGPGRR